MTGSGLDESRFNKAGSGLRLCEAGPFTFEPHVRRRGDRWGFKREDVFSLAADGSAFIV